MRILSSFLVYTYVICYKIVNEVIKLLVPQVSFNGGVGSLVLDTIGHTCSQKYHDRVIQVRPLSLSLLEYIFFFVSWHHVSYYIYAGCVHAAAKSVSQRGLLLWIFFIYSLSLSCLCVAME